MRIRCPICEKVIENAPDDFAPRPFCSARCKLVDLGRWLDGAYRIPDQLDPQAPGREAGSDRGDPLQAELAALGLGVVPRPDG
jgi:hypothetical protein